MRSPPGQGWRAPGTGGASRTRQRSGRSDRSIWLSVVLAVLFVSLTVAVASGALEDLDRAATRHFRPSAEYWGDVQQRYSPWMNRLNPNRMFALLAATCIAASLWRRSPWPTVLGAVVATASVVSTVAVKVALGRADPWGYTPPSGGSYPSGHTVAVIVCLGGCALVCWPRVPWWGWAPVVLATGLMAAALVVSGAHWASDVLGGVLLGLALVTGVSGLPLRARAQHRGRPLGGRRRSSGVSPAGL